MSTVEFIAKKYGRMTDAQALCVGALVVVGFYYLLRVGEYTPKSRDRLTVPLRKKDILLWHRKKLIPLDSPLELLRRADAATICVANSKNGHKDQTVHHTKTDRAEADPVVAMVHLVYAMRHMGPDTPIGTYRTRNNQTAQVQATAIRTAIRVGALGDGLASAGYDLNQLGSHSLRSGGAMALHMAGCNADTIKITGRWSSNTYLRYIQSQMGETTEGLAQKMAHAPKFQYVGRRANN
jgi:hypothetical protein